MIARLKSTKGTANATTTTVHQLSNQPDALFTRLHATAAKAASRHVAPSPTTAGCQSLIAIASQTPMTASIAIETSQTPTRRKLGGPSARRRACFDAGATSVLSLEMARQRIPCALEHPR